MLDRNLGLGVRRDRSEGRLLVEHVVWAGCSVDAARRGEQEPLYAGLLGQASQVDRRAVVDRVRAFGIEIADRIVRQRREMNDGVETRQVGPPNVADVTLDDAESAEGPRQARSPCR